MANLKKLFEINFQRDIMNPIEEIARKKKKEKDKKRKKKIFKAAVMAISL